MVLDLSRLSADTLVDLLAFQRQRIRDHQSYHDRIRAELRLREPTSGAGIISRLYIREGRMVNPRLGWPGTEEFLGQRVFAELFYVTPYKAIVTKPRPTERRTLP